ncbi:hypothetical protein [Deinococcus hopiensis]|uniref:Uncharacterized protein n=1 Tax=Deinococcus hopiensis KR-140 TaxID=695939 RepID=A0A1W1UDC9_9DEIO|nr:hypothetical protein [Deinococcus hopiensis]SMB79098.1 hypothetical protein SAMN00790413_05759 [Deinococcus hopiensis KR-140]
MTNSTRLIRASQFVLTSFVLLGNIGHARPYDAPDDQPTARTGQNLTGAECQQHLQALEQRLQQAGYRAVSTRVAQDGTLIARWYNAELKMTAVAFMGQKAKGNTFSTSEYAGLIPWSDLLGNQ